MMKCSVSRRWRKRGRRRRIKKKNKKKEEEEEEDTAFNDTLLTSVTESNYGTIQKLPIWS
jgi:hypothetical protein